MSRRSLACFVAVPALLLPALVPWTVTSDRVKAAIARQIHQEYGLRLTVGGPVTLTVLPVPRIKLASVRLADESGAVSAESAGLRAELRLAPLFAAQIRIAELRAAETRVRIGRSAGPAVAGLALGGLQDRLLSGSSWSSRIERLVLTDATVTLVEPGGETGPELRNMALVVRWPDPAGDLEATANATFEDRPVNATLAGLNPRRLMTGLSDAIELKVTSSSGRLNAVGDLSWKGAPAFQGLLAIHAHSIGALARWTGLGVDLQDLDRPASVSGDVRLGPDGLEWPKATIELGSERLEGAVAYRTAGPRPQLRATLAGEDLDLNWILPMTDPSRAEPPRCDYDVRLSATSLRVGPLSLRDAAVGFLISDERAEASVARAGLAGGSVRARITATLGSEGRDIKGLVALDKLDLDRLLTEIGRGRGPTGTLAGQVQFELAGDRSPDLAGQLRGRLALSLKSGELPGVGLDDIYRRSGATAPALGRGGRTRFDQAQLAVELGGGFAEITDGVLDTAATQTILRGRMSLSTGEVRMRTSTRAGGTASVGTERRAFALDLAGPIGSLAVTVAPQGGEPAAAASGPTR